MRLENFIKFVKYYGKGRKFKMCGFFVLSSMAACLEFVGIALIYPVILMLVNKELFIKNPLYEKICTFTGTSDAFANAMIIGTCIIGIFLLKNLFMIYFLKLQWKFITYWKRDIKKLFFNYLLYTNYNNLLKISYSDRIYDSTTVIESAMDSFVLKCFNLLTNSIIVTVIVALLFYKFPIAAFTAICFITISLIIQSKFFKQKTIKIGAQLNQITRDYNKNTHNIFQYIKEIAIFSKQEYFANQNIMLANKNAKALIDYQFYTSIPPYIIEMLVVIALFILATVIAIQNPQNSTEVVAALAIVAAAIFRIAPALNRVQVAISSINMGREFVKRLNNNYEKFNLKNFKTYKTLNVSKWDFRDKIQIQNINFAYNETPVLKNISFEINKGDFIGIIGLSGAGKSTLADIIMGLLQPQSGKIIVDGITLNENNYLNFREAIAYVPQNSMAVEGSFKENVAWGIPENEIDEKRVIQSLELAQLYDFVKTFPDGINANPIIGSEGLSQGQKQRLAIARALYKNPDIIIFDEATASLDVKVEHDITEMIDKNLSQNITMIAIAHRLSTLKACNKLIYLKDGELVDVGSFSELASKYADFDNLIKLSSIN